MPKENGTIEELLKLLRKSRGGVVSGAELSRALGVSRTSVWKRINQLRERGYKIESRSSAGYCFFSPPDMLWPEEIRDGLDTSLLAREIRYMESTESTNQIAAELARQGAPDGTLVVADAQTRGRGRLGRMWISPPKCNLYFSLVLRPEIPPARIPQITLIAGVSLCESLKEQTGLPVEVKWPNDLWVRGKKVGGILTEMFAEMDRVGDVILGVGVNVNMTVGNFPPELRDQATSLSMELGRTLNRVSILQGLLTSLEKDYRLFAQHGFEPFRERWDKVSMMLGRSVRVQMPRGEFTGRALSIDEQGHLCVETDSGSVEHVISGDVILVPETSSEPSRPAGPGRS